MWYNCKVTQVWERYSEEILILTLSAKWYALFIVVPFLILPL